MLAGDIFIDMPFWQIAYFVPDAAEAARRHSTRFGSGPFILHERVAFDRVRHHGVESSFNHTAAFGWWSGVVVEFMQQDVEGPSILRDLYPLDGPRAGGLHHMAVHVRDMSAAVAHFARHGHPECLRFAIDAAGLEGVMVDTVKELGHYVELFEAGTTTRFFATLRELAENWDGTDVVREVPVGH